MLRVLFVLPGLPLSYGSGGLLRSYQIYRELQEFAVVDVLSADHGLIPDNIIQEFKKENRYLGRIIVPAGTPYERQNNQLHKTMQKLTELENYNVVIGRHSVLVSLDGINYTTIYSTTTGSGGIEETPVNANARYVKLNLSRRVNDDGFNLHEPQVNDSIHSDTPINLALNEITTASSLESSTKQHLWLLMAIVTLAGQVSTRTING